MTTEIQTPFSPENLRKNFDRIQSDLNLVQTELDQALGVWRAILASEKEEFKKILEDREKTWDRDQTQWEKDRLAYEQKIQDVESFFTQQLATTEKNAVRALNELDAAWQQERQRWQQTVAQQTKDARQQIELQSVSHQQLEQRVADLNQENAELRAQLEHLTTENAQQTDWQIEKSAWQQALSERQALIHHLQDQVIALEEQRQVTEDAQRVRHEDLESYTNSLETQVASLQELLQQMLLPSHPLRRQADRLWTGGDRVASIPRATN
jgi:hypothetical protein